MYVKSALLAAALAVSATGVAGAADLPTKAAKPAVEAPFFFVNDNSVSYHYEFTATNPGAGQTPKHVLSYTHFDVWAYGTNFINIDWLKATNAKTPPFGTPAAPCDRTAFTGGASGCDGYTEIYGFFRSTYGWNQLFNTKAFSVGPLTNISFMIGADLNTDNTTLGSAKRSIEGGVQFNFATPYKGFLNAGVVAYKEWQNDGFAALFGTNPSGKVDFKTTWGFEMLWSQPLGFLPPSIPLTYVAIVGMHGPKGAGEPGAASRKTEYFTQQTLSWDVGSYFYKPGFFSVWGGYRWWKNKFGIDPVASGLVYTVESTWLLGVTMKF